MKHLNFKQLKPGKLYRCTIPKNRIEFIYSANVHKVHDITKTKVIEVLGGDSTELTFLCLKQVSYYIRGCKIQYFEFLYEKGYAYPSVGILNSTFEEIT